MWRRLIILLILPAISYAGTLNCKDIRQGVFKSHDIYGSLHTIVRTNEKQRETIGMTGTIIEYDIHWTSDCTFQLLNGKIIRGSDSIIYVNNSDTIFNEVKEANSYWHRILSCVNGCFPGTEINLFSVDTINTYKDFDSLGYFGEYNGAKRGATFVGYNYAVIYRQHSTDTSKFLFSFTEVLSVNNTSKYKLLDNIFLVLDTNQKITLGNCRFNENYDKEILAIYISNNPNKDAFIIRAWRFNKLSMKIEEVNVNKVKFKEADKRISFWSD
jgi:hypothetical protein